MKKSPETLAAQAGGRIDAPTGALVPALHTSTTFARDPGYALVGPHEYARDDNPTFLPCEDVLGELEGGAALVFASGMAAASAVVESTVRTGDHVVASRAMYWSFRNRLRALADRFALDLELCDPGDVARAVRPGVTRLVWIETPANPTWDVVDVAAAAGAAHAGGALLAVDSTAATPVLSRPLELGADFVMHSATKYLSGHGDVVAGAVVVRDRGPLWQSLRAHRRGAGSVLGPFEAWLLSRGMRTLFVRVARQCESALALAEALAKTPGIREVLYPGLPTHPGHAIAARQMRGGFGGMLSVRVDGGRARALEVAGKLTVFARATSFGGTESLVEHRASVEGPGSLAPEDLLRLSVGLEPASELLDDLRRALGA
ncbi:MAG: aminotransferase class V-fold PLP-dependent enzyme [Myxococcales bacterium]|nr:aminotransferase class V-fold PLP-dependent enzyme [Myxococcales bacterium]